MQYRIRKAKRSDIKNIIDLAVSMVEHSISPFRDLPLKEARDFREHDLESLYKSISNPNLGIFVAEKMDGTFIGHVICMNHYVESSTGESQGYIFDISINKGYQKMGIGKNLMKTAEEFSKHGGMKYMALNVTASNNTAVEFYENLGYSVERKRMVRALDDDKGKS